MHILSPRDIRTRIEFEDGSELTVREIYADRIAYDMERQRRQWPPMTEAPMLALAFMAYTAARRQGLVEDGFEQFTNRAAEITKVTADGRPVTYNKDGQGYVEGEPALLADAVTFDDADPIKPATPGEPS